MASDSVRHLFPQLLKNGFTPIPNRDKHCYLPKWSTIDVDEEQCRLWARQVRWPAIGLRMEPPLLVLDFDIPDIAVLKAIEDITPSVVFDGLERHGNVPKTAFFLRMDERDEPFYQLRTHKYHLNGDPKKGFALEAFAGGGGGKQVGAFGPHSHDDAGNVLLVYSWVGNRSPATVALAELPVLRRAEVAALIDAVDVLLADWPGMRKDERHDQGGDGSQEHVYTITEATVFVDGDGCEWSYDEVVEQAKALHKLKQPPMRVTGSFANDGLPSSGSARCKVHWGERFGLSVVDFRTGLTHHTIFNTDDTEMEQLLNEVFTKRNAR
jgi:hypothetical protein